MESITYTLTNKVRVNIVEWDNQHAEFVSFDEVEKACFFWALRDNIVPNFREETCFLSQNPYTKQWHVIDHLTVDPDPKNKEKVWMQAWYDGRLKYGNEVWRAYYQGVRDEQNNAVFEKENGKKYFPEIK